MKKAVIIIDGQNLSYDLRAMQLKEKDVNWTKLFNDIVGTDSEFIRAYWFRPEKINGLITKQDVLESFIVKRLFNHVYKDYNTKGIDVIAPNVRKEIETKSNEVFDWVKEQQRKFEATEKAYDQLCLTHDNIEVVKSGVVRVDSISMEYLGEKGVDIAVAVKMIDLSIGGKCDKIILISGDYDYVEAIQYVKNNLIKFNVVSFLKANQPNSTAKGLSVITDKVIEITEADMKSKYKQYFRQQ